MMSHHNAVPQATAVAEDVPATHAEFPVTPTTGEQIEENPLCAICQKPFGLHEPVKTLPCGHFFHPPCVDNWLATNVSCPVDFTIVVARGEATVVSAEREAVVPCRGCGRLFERSPGVSPNSAHYYRCPECLGVGATIMSICPFG